MHFTQVVAIPKYRIRYQGRYNTADAFEDDIMNFSIK